MLEWYRAFSDWEQIRRDLEDLLVFLSPDGESLRDKFKSRSVSNLFQEYVNFDLHPTTSLEELKELAKSLGLNVDAYTLWDDVFYYIFVEKIEPFLESGDPLFVTHYPSSQAAFSRLNSEGWGERFELYWKGFEIANAFHELNDPDIQMARFHEDIKKKNATGRKAPPLDSFFEQALRSGMPPSGGIALGIERLFMALTGQRDIRKLQPFPYL